MPKTTQQIAVWKEVPLKRMKFISILVYIISLLLLYAGYEHENAANTIKLDASSKGQSPGISVGKCGYILCP